MLILFLRGLNLFEQNLFNYVILYYIINTHMKEINSRWQRETNVLKIKKMLIKKCIRLDQIKTIHLRIFLIDRLRWYKIYTIRFFKNLFKGVSYAHRGGIYLIRNTVKKKYYEILIQFNNKITLVSFLIHFMHPCWISWLGNMSGKILWTSYWGNLILDILFNVLVLITFNLFTRIPTQTMSLFDLQGTKIQYLCVLICRNNPWSYHLPLLEDDLCHDDSVFWVVASQLNY